MRNTFYRGPPSLYYVPKLQKHRTNSVLMGENKNTNPAPHPYFMMYLNSFLGSFSPPNNALKNYYNIDRFGTVPQLCTKTSKV